MVRALREAAGCWRRSRLLIGRPRRGDSAIRSTNWESIPRGHPPFPPPHPNTPISPPPPTQGPWERLGRSGGDRALEGPEGRPSPSMQVDAGEAAAARVS